MWPWEHLAFGYLLYSLVVRLGDGDPPRTAAALALCVGTQLPDLIDKPLAWVVGVLPSGRSLGHSLPFAVVLLLVVVALSRTSGTPAPGTVLAFAVGHLSHLAGDVLYPVLIEGELSVRFLLWPIVPAAGGGSVDALPHLFDLIATFLAFLATPRGALYALFEVALLSAAVVVWIVDGSPGLAALRRVLGGRRVDA